MAPGFGCQGDSHPLKAGRIGYWMLAYVFVHRPAAAADRREYLTRLRSFHDALAAAPSRGFRRSWVWQVETGPLGEAFEDWYLVEDWAALGALNEAAVTGPRKAPHDEVAPRAVEGVGAIYGLMHGEPVDSASYRLKVTKPLGASYPQFEARLREATGPTGVLWKRQMVLGPDHEFLVDSEMRPAEDVLVLGQRIDVSALHAPDDV